MTVITPEITTNTEGVAMEEAVEDTDTLIRTEIIKKRNTLIVESKIRSERYYLYIVKTK